MLKALWKKLINFFDPTVEPVGEITPPTFEEERKARKKRDTTKLTQYHYDFIVRERKAWELNNEGKPRAERETIEEFVQRLNETMGTNKSVRALHRVWSGELERDSLPAGTPCFAY